MRFVKGIFFGIIIIIFASCGSKKRIVKNKTPKVIVVEQIPEEKPSVEEIEHIEELEKVNNNLNQHTLKYVRKFAPIAVAEMHEHKIPASITLAQGILESGNGRSQLAAKSNNHFGIKCHKGWQGKSVSHDDDEKGECFRKYDFPETSYVDHSIFLTSRKRYANLFTLQLKDYKRWAKGLRKAGYATDPRYPQKLIKIIEAYKLYEFDRILPDGTKSGITELETIDEPVSEPAIVIEKSIGNYYEVQQGDTLYSIAKKHNTTVEKLKEINGLAENTISIGQHLLTR